MYHKYDPQEFAALLQRAVGNTKKKEFASLIDVSPEYLSRILNAKLANPPSISKIQSIAQNANNGVTYAQLLSAAGYAAQDETDPALAIPTSHAVPDLCIGHVGKYLLHPILLPINRHHLMV